jgi:hypothetical protein
MPAFAPLEREDEFCSEGNGDLVFPGNVAVAPVEALEELAE